MCVNFSVLLSFLSEDLDDRRARYVFLQEGIDARNRRPDSPVGVAHLDLEHQRDQNQKRKNGNDGKARAYSSAKTGK